MTRKWVAHSVPATVVAKELEFNRDNLLNTFERIFDDSLRGAFPEIHKSFGIDPYSKAAYPKVNVISTDDNIQIEAEIAGYAREDISVEVEDDVLSIVGKTAPTEQTDKSVYLVRELKRSSFSRSFRLSEQLDTNNVDATFKDGLLKIVIPRKVQIPESRVSKVTIK